MLSVVKRSANRQMTKRSTGPRRAAGKARSSTNTVQIPNSTPSNGRHGRRANFRCPYMLAGMCVLDRLGVPSSRLEEVCSMLVAILKSGQPEKAALALFAAELKRILNKEQKALLKLKQRPVELQELEHLHLRQQHLEMRRMFSDRAMLDRAIRLEADHHERDVLSSSKRLQKSGTRCERRRR